VVLSVTSTSADGAYAQGSVLSINVTFDQDITVPEVRPGSNSILAPAFMPPTSAR